FRLQSTSEFRGADGSDQSGPFPFTEEVFFVGPEGSNENDGLAVSTAWRTLDYAVQQLKPGQTLYLLTGSYELNVPLAGLAKADAATRSRACDDVSLTITNPVRISDAHNISLSRLTFTAGVTIADSSGISVENCVFEGNSGGLTFVSGNGLRLLHNEFR